jgi:antitoxin PrlF
MSILTITAKGQVTLRKEVLVHLGVGPGDQIVVEVLPGGRISVAAAAKNTIDRAFGLLKSQGKRALTIDDIAEITAEAWAAKR